MTFSKNREKYFERNTNLYLGVGAGLGPVVYFRIVENIYLFYLTLFAVCLLSFLFQKYYFLRNLFHRVATLGIFLGLTVALLWFRAGDTWVEGGIEKNDPTVRSIINLSGVNLILFLLRLMISLTQIC
jgi:ABC-type polysaccharide/polyol phosphate export permease